MTEPSTPTPTGGAWSSRVRSSTGELAALVESRSAAELSDAELVDALTAHRRLACQHEGAQLALAGELLRRRETQQLDADQRGPRHRAEVAARVGMELRVAWAQTRTRVEQRLHLSRSLSQCLPRTQSLLNAGRIDEYVAAIVATELTQISDPALVAVAEEVLLDRLHVDANPATSLVATDSTKVRRLARLTLAEADPASFDERYNRAIAKREVTHHSEGDGMARLTLTHNSVDVEAVHHRLTMLAIGLGADDPRTIDQRRADLVLDLLLDRVTAQTSTADLEDGVKPVVRTHPGSRAQINITVPIQTLLGVADDPGIGPRGEPIPASLARQIAASPESTWYRMLTDRAGNMLDLSAHSYRHSEPLVRAIDARDQTSMAPGASTPAFGCDHDHTVPYPRGTTSYGNSGLLSRFDHVIRHSPGFGVVQPEPGVFMWTMPTGHTWTRYPPPQPVGHWPQQWRQPVSAHQIQQGLDALERQQARQTKADLLQLRRRIDDARLQQWHRRSPSLDHLDLTAADEEVLTTAAQAMMSD